MNDQSYYNIVAIGTAMIVLTAGFVGAMAKEGGVSSQASDARTSYVNLTIAINSTTGVPQYAPANFTVPTGKVVVRITDRDSPMAWAPCTCQVSGTVGGTEMVNGTPVSSVDPSNVAHTFTVSSLGLNVLSPGASIVSFVLELSAPGVYSWFCLAPCGSNGYTGFPMGTPGYMTGTLTVS
ncbi:MAG TPA: hypothetical protein VFG07_04335 [Thermoplasmata archaeon]|nr:hypothetical protein [Thermoplasmata archaeon]